MTDEEMIDAWARGVSVRRRTEQRHAASKSAERVSQNRKTHAMIFHETLSERIFGGFDARVRREMAAARC